MDEEQIRKAVESLAIKSLSLHMNSELTRTTNSLAGEARGAGYQPWAFHIAMNVAISELLASTFCAYSKDPKNPEFQEEYVVLMKDSLVMAIKELTTRDEEPATGQPGESDVPGFDQHLEALSRKLAVEYLLKTLMGPKATDTNDQGAA